MTDKRKDMISAFKLYYSINKGKGSTMTDKEIKAVENCLFLFKRIKNGVDILKAVEDIYIKSNKSGGNVASRVRRLAAETYTSERIIYRYLQKATEIYTKEIELLS